MGIAVTVIGGNMELFEAMQKRRSVRSYTGELIDDALLDKLLQAGLLAPTSRNKKPCEFILVRNREVLTSLARAKAAGSAMLKDAAAAIVVIADSEKSDVWIEDASIALTYLHLAATDLGIGSCWVQCRNRQTAEGGDSEDHVKQMLAIPQRYRLVGILSLGIAKDVPAPHSIEDADCAKIHNDRF